MFNLLKKTVILFILLVTPSLCPAQAPTVEWEVLLGDTLTSDYGMGAYQTDDGGYIVGGNCSHWNGGYADNVLFKLDASGDTLWSHARTTLEYQENAAGFRLLRNGDYLFYGVTDEGPGGTLAYVYSANPDGSTALYSSFGDDTLGEGATGADLIGGTSYAVMTRLWYDGIYGWDMKFNMLDNDGWYVWSDHYFVRGAESGAYIQKISTGGYIITGSAQDTSNWDQQLLMVKLTEEGNIEEWRMIGGETFEMGYCVIETDDGGFLTTGYKKRSDNVVKDVYVVKTTSSCNVEWSKVYGFSYHDEGRCCAQTPDGGYVIGATCRAFTDFDFWLLRLDANGDTLWTKVVEREGSQSLYTVDVTDDGGYLLCGNSTMTGEDTDMYVVKLSPENGIADRPETLPNRVRLLANYPNPFNAVTKIQFNLDKPQFATVKLYDILGRELETIATGEFPAGSHSIDYDASGLASGTYLYKLETADISEVNKMLLIK
jgi:hypothetical protein